MLKQGTDLLAENPIPAPPTPLWLPTGEPKPRGRPRKRPNVENKVEQDGSANDSASTIRTIGPWNQLAYKPKTDHGRISGENSPLEGLVRPMQEFAKSVIKTISKVRESKTFDEAINDSIHGNRWCESVDKELWNLDTHQMWYYTSLPNNWKAIGCK